MVSKIFARKMTSLREIIKECLEAVAYVAVSDKKKKAFHFELIHQDSPFEGERNSKTTLRKA
jgi:hypothetical protein